MSIPPINIDLWPRQVFVDRLANDHGVRHLVAVMPNGQTMRLSMYAADPSQGDRQTLPTVVADADLEALRLSDHILNRG